MKNTCKNEVISILQHLVLEEPRIKVRYGFDFQENLHLIEVAPEYIYDESIVERFENQMTLECIGIDSTASVMFITEGDADFAITDCIFEEQGEAYGFDKIDFVEQTWSNLDLTYETPIISEEYFESSLALAA